MGIFSEALAIRPGVTAIIGSGGKTSLLYRLADELKDGGSVLVTTSTHILPPEHLPVYTRTERVRGVCCVGAPCGIKLKAPEQSFEELAGLADFVLVEADGSAHLPIKAHASYEPPIPPNANNRILVVGVSGLNRPVGEAAHRAERFRALSGSELASPEAVAAVIRAEALCDRVVLNQAETNPDAARRLAALLPYPVLLTTLNKGELLCSY